MTDVLAQASAVGVDPPQAILTLIEAAAPTAPIPVAVRGVAALLGHSERTAEHLTAEVITLANVRRAELARAERDARAVERAERQVARHVAHLAAGEITGVARQFHPWVEPVQSAVGRSGKAPGRCSMS